MKSRWKDADKYVKIQAFLLALDSPYMPESDMMRLSMNMAKKLSNQDVDDLALLGRLLKGVSK
mgnify:CR=1 FL=1